MYVLLIDVSPASDFPGEFKPQTLKSRFRGKKKKKKTQLFYMQNVIS